MYLKVHYSTKNVWKFKHSLSCHILILSQCYSRFTSWLGEICVKRESFKTRWLITRTWCTWRQTKRRSFDCVVKIHSKWTTRRYIWATITFKQNDDRQKPCSILLIAPIFRVLCKSCLPTNFFITPTKLKGAVKSAQFAPR